MELNLREILEDGISYMKRISANLEVITNKDVKDEMGIINTYETLKEGLNWISDVLKHFEDLTDINYSEITINKQVSDVIIKNYNELLVSLDEMFESGHYKELQASISNELPKHLKKLISLFKKVDEHIAKSMN